MFCRPDLDQTNKTVREYYRPKHEQRDVAAKIECESCAKHEQHKAQKRSSLLPPQDEQTSPNRHDDARSDWSKKGTEIQNATANHPSGDGRVNSAVRSFQAAPFRVVESD